MEGHLHSLLSEGRQSRGGRASNPQTFSQRWVTLCLFRSDLVIEAKADASPVTEADRQAEAAMRKLIQESFPDHGIFGEEEGLHVGSAPGNEGSPSYLWVLDPIDGTKSFITGWFSIAWAVHWGGSGGGTRGRAVDTHVRVNHEFHSFTSGT